MALLETSIRRWITTSRDDLPYPGKRNADGSEIRASDVPVGSTCLVKAPDGKLVEMYHWTGREWISGETPEVHELRQIAGLLAELVEQGKAAF